MVDILLCVVLSLLVLAILICVWMKTKNPILVLLSLLFCIYIFQVAKLTILDTPLPEEYDYVGFENFHINLVPFKMGMPFASLTWFDILEPFILNILLTIPFGFFACTFWNLKPRAKFILAFCAGSSVEITQLIISLIIHYPYRVVDINDAIANGAGVVLGYALFSSCSAIYKKWFIRTSWPIKRMTEWLTQILVRGD